MRIDGHTLVLGLIGDPVAHTFSPLIQNTFAEKRKINSAYLPFPVRKGKDSLKDAVRGAFALGITGLNVTVPYKSEVISYLSDIDPLAEKIGAVNTLVRTEHGYKGYNTDILGLEQDLLQHGTDLTRIPAVLIIGAGGAARAAACLCGEKGVGTLYMINRSPVRAAALCADLRRFFPDMKTVVLSDSDTDAEGLPDHITTLQCTSAGLYPDVDTLPVRSEAVYRKIGFAYDLIYTPAETAFLKKCAACGTDSRNCVNGTGMLLYQAAASYTLWMDSMGIKAGIGSDVLEEACERLQRFIESSRKRKRNIILTGFMGSGKTTVGRILSEKLGMPFFDTDSLIEEREGRRISEIFEASGEAYFRDLETALLRELCGNGIDETAAADAAVYSTGGGIVLKEENRRLLGEAGTVVFLKAGTDAVIRRLKGDDTRPLLKGDDREQKISRLLLERKDFYEEKADITIDTDSMTAKEAAGRIIEEL